MSETVFILGAGASYDAGVPLMDNFIDRAEELLLNGDSFVRRESFDRVFELIGVLQNVYAKSFLNLDNIESLFGAVEMSNVIKRLGDYSTEEIAQLRADLTMLIVETIEQSMRFPVKNTTLSYARGDATTYTTGNHVLPTETYQKFVELIRRKFRDCSVITFNYDVGLDLAMWRSTYEEPSYCLADDVGCNIPILKLHGSINWAECPNHHIIPIKFNDSVTSVNGQSDFVHFSFYKPITETKCSVCGEACVKPVVVPPTWNKTEYHGALANVWSRASRELSNARNIFVIGYSLPESDAFFRYLYALSTAGRSRIQRFWVYNPDTSEATKARYEQLLGAGVRKKRYMYWQYSFAASLKHMDENVKP